MTYPDVLLHIDGAWRDGASRKRIDVIDPATESVIGQLATADRADLDEALAASARGFAVWRATSAFERSKLMRAAATLLRERADAIAPMMVAEQGKPLVEARLETLAAADIIDWFAEEGRRTYGRVIPARLPGVYQLSLREPVGPVAAFSPWNFPINQVVRKMCSALAAGCSIIVKAPEETPASPAELIRVFVDAGVPKGVINLVYGDPATISEYLIPHPVIRKISFTGSTAVGKRLAALAGGHMKRATMELGGHAPAIVFADADIDAAARVLGGAKFRNAGQICVSPTRFLVQDAVYAEFTEKLEAVARAVKVGNGMEAGTTMGPLANHRRLETIDQMVRDAEARGGRVVTGGRRIGNEGYFYEPTVIADATVEMRAMNEEPFGPLAMIAPFSNFDEVVTEANRLPFGLASYVYARSSATVTAAASAIEAGMVSINSYGLAMPETPFGGVKESGYGSEGGSEALEGYLVTKFVSQTGA